MGHLGSRKVVSGAEGEAGRRRADLRDLGFYQTGGRTHWGLDQVVHRVCAKSRDSTTWGGSQVLLGAKNWTGHLTDCPPESEPRAKHVLPRAQVGCSPPVLVANETLPSRDHLLVHTWGCGLWQPPVLPLGPHPIPHGSVAHPVSHMSFPFVVAGDQEALQPHPGGDLPLLLAPPTDQQPHFLHSGAGKAPATPRLDARLRSGQSLSPVHVVGGPTSAHRDSPGRGRHSSATGASVSSGGAGGHASRSPGCCADTATRPTTQCPPSWAAGMRAGRARGTW